MNIVEPTPFVLSPTETLTAGNLSPCSVTPMTMLDKRFYRQRKSAQALMNDNQSDDIKREIIKQHQLETIQRR